MPAPDAPNNKYLHRSWPELAQFYASFPTTLADLRLALDALGHLCEAIHRSHLNDQLFAHTSHERLMICQSRNVFPPPQGVAFLVIHPLSNATLRVSIERWGQGEDDWVRVVEHTDLVKKFNTFLRQLGWSYHDLGV